MNEPVSDRRSALRTVLVCAFTVVLLTALPMGWDKFSTWFEQRPDGLSKSPDHSEKVKRAWEDVLAFGRAGDEKAIVSWHRGVFGEADADVAGTRRPSVTSFRSSLKEMLSAGISEVRVVRFTTNTPRQFDTISDLRYVVRRLKTPVPLYSVRFYKGGAQRCTLIWDAFAVSSGGEIRFVDTIPLR